MALSFTHSGELQFASSAIAAGQDAPAHKILWPVFQQRDEATGLSFQCEYRACGGRGPHERGASTEGYVASDGTRLTLGSEGYDTVRRAKQRLRNLFLPTTEIIEQGAKLDSRGRTIGMRYVVVDRGQPDMGRAAVLWREGSRVWYAYGPTVEHVLALERLGADWNLSPFCPKLPDEKTADSGKTSEE